MINRRIDDGSNWPAPGDEMEELAHRLRYQDGPEYDAASIVEAYMALIALPVRTRERKVRMIRKHAWRPSPGKEGER